jgi:hypothetical protein
VCVSVQDVETSAPIHRYRRLPGTNHISPDVWVSGGFALSQVNGAQRRLVSGEGDFVVDIDFQRGGVVHEKIAVPKPAPASL